MLKSTFLFTIALFVNFSNLYAQNAVNGQIYVSGIGSIKAISANSLSVTSTINSNSSFFTGIAVDIENIWAVDNSNNSLYKINKETFAVTNKLTTGSAPFAVSVDETFAWVTNQVDHTVSKFNKSSGALIATINLPIQSEPYGISSDGNFVWVANLKHNSVTKINAITNAVMQTIILEPRTPSAEQLHGGNNQVAPTDVKSDGENVWVATSKDILTTLSSEGSTTDGAIRKINILTGEVSIIEINSAPITIYVDNYNIWTSQSESGEIEVIDKVSLKRNALYSTPFLESNPSATNTPWGISFDGNNTWVSLRNGITSFTQNDGGLLKISPNGDFTRISSFEAGLFRVSHGDMTGLSYDLLFGSSSESIFSQSFTSLVNSKVVASIAKAKSKGRNKASRINDDNLETFFVPKKLRTGSVTFKLPEKTILNKAYIRLVNLTGEETKVDWTLQYRANRRWNKIERRVSTFSNAIWVHVKSDINVTSKQFRIKLRNKKNNGKRRKFGIAEVQGFN